jgi:glycerol-3-phosphate acyltransferase PlsY
MVLLTRISSAGGMAGAASAPVAAFFFQRIDLIPPMLAMALIVLWRHRANIARLLKGTEPKVGKKAA